MSMMVTITNSNINVVNGDQENLIFIFIPVTINMTMPGRDDEPHNAGESVAQGLARMYRR